ncbi:response regulator transcription factor [Anaerobium acetethylicum]|uniref:Stage 0 sporulation protein A homolog n=1 Tax=Anaerobium acetethylicum TaxID=1619234 RepID=A0A1D3TNF0_9FIRM|nr:response regulator [Anaerobium acetethylicum]SCP94844.1 Two-component response regulator, YesN/AraC family, consists of REC and AraC-type DNA-binding domains [Anaerobium acetethylicum]
MINAIVVEDEQVIRNGILNHVPWKKLGIENVMSAEHAGEAFLICEDTKPDLIISDINMPGMNGVTLCQKLREKFPESEIIFVTGFSDKEYLKAAIQLHAVSYVEKPVNIQELTEAVAEAAARIEKARSQRSAVVQSLFTNSNSINYALTEDKFFEVCLIHLKNEADRISAMEMLNQKLTAYSNNVKIHCQLEQVDRLNIAALFSDTDAMGKRLKSSIHTFYSIMKEAGIDYFLAFGTEEQGQDKIQASYEAAAQALKCLSYKDWNHIATQEDIPVRKRKFSVDRAMLDRFTQALAQKDKEQAVKNVREMTKTLVEERLFINADIRYLYYSLEDVMLRLKRNVYTRETETQPHAEHSREIENAETLYELEQYICDLIKKNEFIEDDSNNSYIIQKVMDYVLQHYTESDLSIKTLAEHVYLTPTYLSNLFKKNTGITIGQYLVNVRVDQAKLLLQNPKWKLYQIAPMVGYEDSNYFAKIFKKKLGVTPSEYREKMVV